MGCQDLVDLLEHHLVCDAVAHVGHLSRKHICDAISRKAVQKVAVDDVLSHSGMLKDLTMLMAHWLAFVWSKLHGLLQGLKGVSFGLLTL